MKLARTGSTSAIVRGTPCALASSQDNAHLIDPTSGAQKIRASFISAMVA